ncbi:hypothetical protein LTR86_009986 [Recurvomyces mirabilis]|nr:hypothetical protein LTR86_009986 [Recurvomyces mirabilis]
MTRTIPPSWVGHDGEPVKPSELNAAIDFDCAFFSKDELRRYNSHAHFYTSRKRYENYISGDDTVASRGIGRLLDEYRQIARVRTIDTVGISFTTKRISNTTWVIQEDDMYKEHPLIYVKLLPQVPVILLCDTGSDAPTKENRPIVGTSTHLRHYLESVPIKSNSNQPLNPNGKLTYFIIQTHCHYDHIGGIPQFLRGGTTQILASAAGRDFIEKDFSRHSLWPGDNGELPRYCVTKWAQTFEPLSWPLSEKYEYDDDGHPVTQQPPTSLGITVLHTPGHTPDELAWYDHAEMHLYVGDSFYREGEEDMPIIFPPQGNLIEWVFSMQKLAVFVRGENARAAAEARLVSADAEDDWEHVASRVKVSCAHITTAVDGAEILAELEAFSFKVFVGKVPVVRSEKQFDEEVDLWKEKGKERTPMSILAPRRLMQDARKFFGHDVTDE